MSTDADRPADLVRESRTLGRFAGPRLIPCDEHGPVDVPLEEVLDASGRLRLDPEIEKGDYFAVSMKQGTLTLRARGYIGFVPLNDRLVVHIRPRVPIANLTRVAQIAGVSPMVLTLIRDYAIGGHWNDSLADLYATALVRHVEAITAAGLLRDYQRREEVSSFPSGRVLFHRSVQNLQARGVRHAAHVTWFERSADNACNRCLKYALWVMVRHYIESRPNGNAQRRLHQRLVALSSVFDGVELDHSKRFLYDAVVCGTAALPTLRAYYRDALTVALAIIHQRAVLIEDPDGSLRLPSMVLNMETTFEAYVRRVLALHAAEEGWRVDVLDGNTEGKRPLFEAPRSRDGTSTLKVPDATPDVVLRMYDGTTLLVLEVKNIPVTGFSPRDAFNQAVTYAVAYGIGQVVLVHPCASGQTSGMHKIGKIGDIAVYQYRFDLSSADLPEEDERFGRAVAALLPSASL